MGGCFFVKKWKMGGVVVKKVESGSVFVKKWIFPQCRVHYVQYQYFLFYILYLFGGVCARTQRTPLPTGLVKAVVYWGVYTGIRRIPTSGVFLTAYTHLSDHK